MLRSLDVLPLEVRTEAQLGDVDGLILPGGESTAMARLIDYYALRHPLSRFAQTHPVWGTCAGLILLADSLAEQNPEPLRILDVRVKRNVFGRQVDSFEADLTIEDVDGGPYHALFIRAPVVLETSGAVRVLARLGDGSIVAVRQGHILGTAFHPELTKDARLHRYFVRMVEEALSAR